MAVKISGLKPTIACPATLYLPADGGAQVPYKFDVHFKRQTTSERNALNERFVKGEITQRQMLDEVVVGWGGMLDEAGQPVPYSIAERIATDELYPGLEQAMAVSWYDNAFVNQREAAVKNSKAPSVTGSAPMTQTATS